MRTLLAVFILALTLPSCKKPLNDTQRKINNGVNITMVQEHGLLTLHIATNESFACSNNTIALNFVPFHPSKRKGDLDFWYVQTHKDCLPPGGPATADVQLGRLSPGKYSLTLTYNNKKKHTVTFIATADKYTAANTRSGFFSFTNTEVSLQ